MDILIRVLTICALFMALECNAQKLSVHELMTAWSIDDLTQTKEAEATYYDLEKNFHSDSFKLRLAGLYDEINKNHDKRIEVRTIMYELTRKRDPTQEDFNRIRYAINLTFSLGDEQLLSELYTIYGKQTWEFFFLLKAIEIQEKIGPEHFPLLNSLYYHTSELMFFTKEYRASIQMGKKALLFFEKNRNPIAFEYVFHRYILQLDIMGSAYRELGMGDSTVYYYKKLKSALDPHESNLTYYNNPTLVKDETDLWLGIADGGIGQGYLLQGKINEAYQLLSRNVASSQKLNHLNDAALALNSMAEINFLRKNYDLSLEQYRRSYQWSINPKGLENIIKASKGLSEVFSKIGRHDSAYFYLGRFNFYNDSLDNKINKNRFENANAKLENLKMQTAFNDSQKEVRKQLRLRNIRILGFIIIGLLMWMFFWRRYQRLLNDKESLEKKNKEVEMENTLAKQEIMHARLQLSAFTSNISEKNKLIETLKGTIKEENEKYLFESIKSYTILTDEDWTSFKVMLDTAFPGYWQRLDQKMPGLTVTEQRFMALTKLGLDNKEIAASSGISHQSIRVTLHRLKKKYDLTEKDDIAEIAKEI